MLAVPYLLVRDYSDYSTPPKKELQSSSEFLGTARACSPGWSFRGLAGMS